ncbi:MAG: hypothetical protein JSV13_08620 [Nitrospiraceae bacterium]|nr:MAG: hypothetical protein JSV13_08620 [Nitrospiraceae bacterium]
MCRGFEGKSFLKTTCYYWHGTCIYMGKMNGREGRKMKERTYTKKMAYMGAGCGLVLFAIFGLLPGSFLGGVMGLNIAGTLLGTPVTSGILARMIVAGSMLIGVMVSGIIFITASATAGWLIGAVVDTFQAEKKELSPVEEKNHK